MARIIAFGDIHMDLGPFERIPGIAEADCLVITGDLTNFGGPLEASEIIDRVRAVNQNILALAGNLDQPGVGPFLARQGIDLHGRGVRVHGVGIFGVGGSNPTPFQTPNELAEQEIETTIEQGYEIVKGSGRAMLVSHAPPYNTTADRLASGAHVGSTAVRRFIEKARPDLCLCGHIHEARSVDHIGATEILNPGMLKLGTYMEILVNAQGPINARLRTV